MRLVQRVVVKVGSSSLTHETGRLDLDRIERLARELSDLAASGKQIVLVSSGAVAAGLGKLGLSERPKTIPEKQAVAAVGQVALMHVYSKIFSEYSQTVAQVLLTREDTVDRKRCVNSLTTLTTLLSMGVIPIVNENDAVAVDELKIGENDSLSAMVASLVGADLLIILSDIDGLYTANPKDHPEATLVESVAEITEAVESSCGLAGSGRGTGGMVTKVQAAKIATSSGIPMVIANSGSPRVLHRILEGESVGTLFLASPNAPGFRKRWLSFGAKVEGSLKVDKGAETSLISSGRSLLPAGIVEVMGDFSQGDAVSVVSESSGREIARGIANYSADEFKLIRGKKSDEISAILGYKAYDEAIHRDHLALLVQERTPA
jgi:glutamate 5-kinase